jgi:hypothetical protein
MISLFPRIYENYSYAAKLIIGGNHETLELHLANGSIDPNSSVLSKNDFSLLSLALQYNKTLFIETLLKYGANPNKVYENSCVLLLAVNQIIREECQPIPPSQLEHINSIAHLAMLIKAGATLAPHITIDPMITGEIQRQLLPDAIDSYAMVLAYTIYTVYKAATQFDSAKSAAPILFTILASSNPMLACLLIFKNLHLCNPDGFWHFVATCQCPVYVESMIEEFYKGNESLTSDVLLEIVYLLRLPQLPLYDLTGDQRYLQAALSSNERATVKLLELLKKHHTDWHKKNAMDAGPPPLCLDPLEPTPLEDMPVEVSPAFPALR